MTTTFEERLDRLICAQIAYEGLNESRLNIITDLAIAQLQAVDIAIFNKSRKAERRGGEVKDRGFIVAVLEDLKPKKILK